jgi:hypothetical protein
MTQDELLAAANNQCEECGNPPTHQLKIEHDNGYEWYTETSYYCEPCLERAIEEVESDEDASIQSIRAIAEQHITDPSLLEHGGIITAEYRPLSQNRLTSTMLALIGFRLEWEVYHPEGAKFAHELMARLVDAPRAAMPVSLFDLRVIQRKTPL